MNYEAAAIEATVKVTAYKTLDDQGPRHPARRTVELSFHEVFTDDVELDLALNTFCRSVIAAARRG